MGEFEGKIALITGGGSGIGQATAERLSAEGAKVIVVDLDQANGKAVAQKLDADFMAADVGDSARWSELVAEVMQRHGGLDIAYLNAGVTTERSDSPDSPLMPGFDLATLSDAAYRRILGANLDGVVFGARAVLPALEARGGGSIIATASVAGLLAFAPDPIYTATKHAVVGLVRSLAPTLLPRKVTINAICPGVVDTNLLGPGGGARVRELGLPVIAAAEIAAAVVQVIQSGETGECWVCAAKREPQKHVFPQISGVGI